MGFYKNAGGIKEYTKENIEDADIPLGTFIMFKGPEPYSEVFLECIERNDKFSCKGCFFKDIMSEYCPTCLPGERKDEQYALYQKL